MKKGTWILALVTALALSGGVAFAAELSNLSGQSCGEFEGTWHFVNNQTGGAGAGTLEASFDTDDDGVVDIIIGVGASAVNNKTQHFFVVSSGELLGASTDLPGRLVLSDFSCDEKKVPPPCDPKTDPTCKL